MIDKENWAIGEYMKRILVMLSIGILMLAACGNDKYVDKIDKAVKMQDQKQEQMAKNDTGDMVKHFDKKMQIFTYTKMVSMLS